jgi:hypothetical protein
MSENVMPHVSGDEDEDFVFVIGAPLDLESVESAIDALAHDEAVQADEAQDRSRAR